MRLAELSFESCRSCWACRRNGKCMIQDDLCPILKYLEEADALVIGSPVHFNNVSSLTKAFMDRTWPLRGRLRNKVGGVIVVGRRYGAESAITAIHAFFLKHEMIVGHRGVTGIAYAAGEILKDEEALRATEALARRVLELCALVAGDAGKGT